MTLGELVYEAIKARKKSVDYCGDVPNYTIEAAVTNAAYKAKVRLTFRYERSDVYIFIYFTYLDPEPVQSKQVNKTVEKKPEVKKNPNTTPTKTVNKPAPKKEEIKKLVLLLRIE